VRTVFICIFASIVAAGLPPAARAAGTDVGQARAVIDQARGHFRDTTREDVTAARAEALDKMEDLKTILNAAEDHGKAWRDYLLWDRLTTQLNNETGVDRAELEAILRRFDAGYPGLELPAIRRLRVALKRYYRHVLGVNDPRLRDEFARRLEQLEHLVGLLSTSDQGKVLQKISCQLAWAKQHEQVPAMVKAIRDLAPETNAGLAVSRDLLARVTRESIDRAEPLTDCILGTTVYGTSFLAGSMVVVPAPGDGVIRLETRLRGEVDAVGRGYHGPVRASVVGAAPVHATGGILFGPLGFRREPARGHVFVRGRPTAIWTIYGNPLADALVTRVARRRAAKTQQLANYIASRHAEQRLEQQFDEELETRLSALQHAYLKNFRKPLLRHDMFPRVFRAKSHENGAKVDLLLAADAQTGAPHPPPASRHHAALSAHIHETALNNLADKLLGGRTVSDARLAKSLRQLFGAQSDGTVHEQEDDFQIVLASERPLTFTMDDSVLTVKIRADLFMTTTNKYPAMTVTVRYKVHLAGGDVQAQRVGEIDVLPPDFEENAKRRLSARETAARRFITRTLESELKQTYHLQGLSLPDEFGRFGALALTELIVDDGWLKLGADPVTEREQIAEGDDVELTRRHRPGMGQER